MYRLGENSSKRRHRHMAFFALVLIVGVVTTFAAKHALSSSTTLTQAPAITAKVTATTRQTRHIDEPLFSLDLPSNWTLESHGANANSDNVYTWRNSTTKSAGRFLSVYVDSIPVRLGVNRALSVKSVNDKVVPVGDVSDNCASFTSLTSGSNTVATPAKWAGVDFLCDLGNYERDVVGTVSPDGLNQVVLNGGTSGKHALFFTYTDNNIQADYTIFLNALQSFHLK